MIHLCPLQRLVKDLIHYLTRTVEEKDDQSSRAVLQPVKAGTGGVFTSGHFSQVERVFEGAEFAATAQGRCDS